MIVYLDSSAFVKLVKAERESAALIEELDRWPDRASSWLLHVEVLRAARVAGPVAYDRARTLLADVALVPLTRERLQQAVQIDPLTARTLDAIHVATALSIGAALGALVTYDRRMLEAATAAGLTTLSPA